MSVTLHLQPMVADTRHFYAYLVGLTAILDNCTYSFFRKNVVSEYNHEKAVVDGVNIGNEIFSIETEKTKQSGKIKATGRASREYDSSQALGITGSGRNIHCQASFLIANDKTDAKGNVVEKGEDPKYVLAQFRNDYYPRIAVTVDMFATDTDVKPLECLLFMRDVKSKNYFEQMKGRGTRTLDKDSLKKVTPSAQSAKTHYVIVDAIGVTKSVKTASQPLITKPSVSFKDLAMGVMMGAIDSDTVSSLAGRLARLDKQLDDKERARIAEEAGGTTLLTIVSELFNAIDGDRVEQKALEIVGQPIGTDLVMMLVTKLNNSW